MITDKINSFQFDKAKISVLTGNYTAHGFGTLQEKTMHMVMKRYYEPNEDCHEVPIGKYIADIYTGEEIIEIQNGNLGKMKEKLDYFLDEYDVYLVYPFPHIKWICWIDPDTGEVTSKRKSNKTGNIYEAIPDFFSIKAYLNNPRLHIRVPLVDVEEYRLLDGTRSKRSKKIGSHRYDRVPLNLYDEIIFDSINDYLQLLPIDLPDQFTTKDLSIAAKIHISLAQETCKLLYDLGFLDRVGKQSRSYLYQISDTFNN